MQSPKVFQSSWSYWCFRLLGVYVFMDDRQVWSSLDGLYGQDMTSSPSSGVIALSENKPVTIKTQCITTNLDLQTTLRRLGVITGCYLVRALVSTHVFNSSALWGRLAALSQDAIQAVELAEETAVGGDTSVVLHCLDGLH